LIPEIQGRIKETKELQEEEKENPVEMEEDQLTTDKENVEPVAKGSASGNFPSSILFGWVFLTR
jgi:hypothetical protein